MNERQTMYRNIPAKDLLSRGRFLTKYYLSTDEMKLGLDYLSSAAAKGNLEAAGALVDAAERECLNIPCYDVLVRDTAIAAVESCVSAEDGVPFLEKLVIYGSKADFLAALHILKNKKITRDVSVTETRMLIAEYAAIGRNAEEMLAACRKNLDCYMIHRFYHSFFSPIPKNKEHFDHITEADAKIMLSSYEKFGGDIKQLLRMIEYSKSPQRFVILENYEREKRLAQERSKKLQELFEMETEEMNLGFLIREMILDFTGSFDEEEEEE